jgi:hypothetical protein
MGTKRAQSISCRVEALMDNGPPGIVSQPKEIRSMASLQSTPKLAGHAYPVMTQGHVPYVDYVG